MRLIVVIRWVGLFIVVLLTFGIVVIVSRRPTVVIFSLRLLVIVVLSGFNLLIKLLNRLGGFLALTVRALGLGFNDRLKDEVVLRRVSIRKVNDISLLPLAEVVIRVGLVATEHLNSGRALDAVFLGQVTVGHHVDGSEFELPAGDASIFSGSHELRVKSFAVWAPVSVEGDHPGVFIICLDLLSPVIGVQLLEVLEHSDGLSGKDCESCCE
jgi:hypothetical protein